MSKKITKNMKKVLAGVLAFAIILSSAQITAFGKSKKKKETTVKTVYVSSWLKERREKSSEILSKVTIDKTSITVKGSLLKGKSIKAIFDDDYQYCKRKSRRFKLSKKVKFYTPDGMDKTREVSRKEFVYLCNWLNKTASCARFRFVVKNRKVEQVSILP